MCMKQSSTTILNFESDHRKHVIIIFLPIDEQTSLVVAQFL